MRASGILTLSDRSARSRQAQLQAGGSDRRQSDEGGHYIAARFDGPTDAFNHFAQDRNFNRGDYKALENKWAASLKSGKRVFVTITPTYKGISTRPSKLTVKYNVDGIVDVAIFNNERKDK